jgi:hypothetical protein
VRFLGALRLLRINARRIRHEVVAELRRDQRPRRLDRLRADVGRVGAHVGDQTDGAIGPDLAALVELLRDRHRALGREAQPPRCLLLECAGSERRRGTPVLRPLANFRHPIRGTFQRRPQPLGSLGVRDLQLTLRLAEIPYEPSAERLIGERLFKQVGVDRPVLARLEVLDLALALDHHPQRHALHAPGGQPAPDLAPEQRRDLVPNQAVEHAPRLLGIDQTLVQLARMLERRANGVARDLVELHPARRPVPEADRLDQVPGDRLALAVRVGRQVHHVGLPGRRLELLDDLVLLARDHVLRREAMLHVYAELGLGQVAHVADRRAHVVLAAQEPGEGTRLRRGLDDHEVLPTRRSPPAAVRRARDRALALGAGRSRRPAGGPGPLRCRLRPARSAHGRWTGRGRPLRRGRPFCCFVRFCHGDASGSRFGRRRRS